jgi:hypothetical protein
MTNNKLTIEQLKALINQPEFRSPHVTSGESIQGADLMEYPEFDNEYPGVGCAVCGQETGGNRPYCDMHQHIEGKNYVLVEDYYKPEKCSCGNPIMTCDCLPF